MPINENVQTSIEIGVDLFKDVVFAAWKAATGFAQEKYRENDPFGIATRKYIGGLIERYNLVKVLGMREPVPLKSLYVRANILEKISARSGSSAEELAAFFDFDRRAFGQKSQTVDGEIIVNNLEKFIVLGKPGAGKTTYLKYLTLMMLDKLSQIERRRLPVFVTLREWADEQIPLRDFIVKQFDICGFEQAEPFVEKMLHDGKCLVLFDGLDEVNQESSQDGIIRQIRNFTDKYSANQFIISCRVAAYNHWFERFTDVEMADFNEEQMETFIKNWFYNDPKSAAECWERLKNSPPLRELASVPLLLTLLCIEYSESNDFPPNRAELYERAIEVLLVKWDGSRKIRRDEVYKHLPLKRKESMFARIAFGTFRENQYFIRERVLAKMIERYIEHLPGFNPAELEPDSRAVLQAVAAQHGIFVERAKDVYSFAHLTFQEYFTAKYIVDNQGKRVDNSGNLDDAGQISLLEYVVEKHLYNPKWKEVFLLVSGMLDNADELLLLMRGKANEALESEEFDALMRLVVRALLPVKSKYPDVYRRSNALICVLAFNYPLAHALGRDRDVGRTRDLARDLAHALGRDLVLVGDLDFDPDLLQDYSSQSNNLNRQIVLQIQNYLSANTLILNCLSSGAYLSNPIREKMIHEMFLPKGA